MVQCYHSSSFYASCRLRPVRGWSEWQSANIAEAASPRFGASSLKTYRRAI